MKRQALIATLTASTVAAEPITLDTLADHAEMIRITDAIDAAVDAKDWPLARSFFNEDVTSLVGGEPATIPADAPIDG